MGGRRPRTSRTRRSYRGTVDDLPEDLRRFDVVAAWDVLEHFADPVAELRKIDELLPEKGTLLFSTLMIDNWFPRRDAASTGRG